MYQGCPWHINILETDALTFVHEPLRGRGPELKATPQATKPTSKSVSIPEPAVQIHAGLYSSFTPSVAVVDQSTLKTLSEAQKTGLRCAVRSILPQYYNEETPVYEIR